MFFSKDASGYLVRPGEGYVNSRETAEVVGEPISTRLDSSACEGPIVTAELGSRLQLKGIVERGDQRGRLLGLPTANVAVPAMEIAEGVWAGTVQIDPDSEGPSFLAAVSVGRRPTYYAESKRLLEAHLLGYNGDLYERKILATLHAFIRPQRRFPGIAELTLQLENDVACVRAWGLGAGHVDPARDVIAVRPSSSKSKWRGRSYPVSQKRSKRRTKDVDDMKGKRAAKRLAVLRRAVSELARAGQLTHEAVAKLTGIPVGYLLWAYPTSESLLAIPSTDSLPSVAAARSR